MIPLGYLNDISKSFTRFTGPPRCQVVEIIKPNNPRENCPKMMEAKYAEKRYLVSRGTFPASIRAELPVGANLITARYALTIKSDGDKEE